MKKTILRTVLSAALVLLLSTATVFAFGGDEMIKYSTNGAVLYIQPYEENPKEGRLIFVEGDPSGHLVIPQKVKGVTIVAIVPTPIPDGLEWTTANNEKLTAITFPGTIKTINMEMLEGCTNLKTITLSEGVEEVSHGARGAGTIRLNLPKSLQSIYGGNFGGDNIEVTLHKDNPYLEMDKQGLIYNEDMTILMASIGKQKENPNVIIPDTVTEIGDYAFANNTSVKSAEMPDSVTQLGESIFYNCEALTSVRLSADLTYIPARMFWDTALAQAPLTDKMTEIGAYAFARTELTSVEIPRSITALPSGLFRDCDALQEVILHDGIYQLGYGVFSDCKLLESVEIPPSVTVADSYALYPGYSDTLDIYGYSGSTAERLAKEVKNQFHSIGTMEMQFRDVKNHWGYGAIRWAFYETIFSGVSATQFAPDSPVTRGMFVTALRRFADYPPTTISSNFEDAYEMEYGNGLPWWGVPVELYYSAGICWAERIGIIQGDGGDYFYPDNPISRQDAALILYKLYWYDLAEQNVSPIQSTSVNLQSFSDAGEISGYATQAVQWAVNTGILTGYNGKLNPQGTATRAEMVQILQNAGKLYPNRY